MSVSAKQQKQLIRQQVRALRNGISGLPAAQAAQKLSHQLQHNDYYLQAKHIACYLSFDGEIDTGPLIAQILNDGKNCYLPKLKPVKPNRLWFMPYTKDSKLSNNHLSIAEVDLPVSQAIAVSQLDLILMPLVAFDLKGNRLGMGGGFYDATLAHLPRQKPSPLIKRPFCIGIAYQQQMLAELPSEPWDFCLDGVLTEKEFYCFN